MERGNEMADDVGTELKNGSRRIIQFLLVVSDWHVFPGSASAPAWLVGIKLHLKSGEMRVHIDDNRIERRALPKIQP